MPKRKRTSRKKPRSNDSQRYMLVSGDGLQLWGGTLKEMRKRGIVTAKGKLSYDPKDPRARLVKIKRK